jgi:hypothetical protein
VFWHDSDQWFPPTGDGKAGHWGYNWDARNLLDHVKRNISMCDGGSTQLDYMASSYYENCPGGCGGASGLSTFDTDAAGFRSYAKQIGLDVLRMFFGIDEGRIMYGPEKGCNAFANRKACRQQLPSKLGQRLVSQDGIFWAELLLPMDSQHIP